MRKFILGIFLTLLTVTTVNATPIPDHLVNAMKTGNAKEISKHFGTNVDLTLPGNEGVFSKAQAELILKSFFAKNPSKAFEVVHNGTSKNDSHYSIGTLTTTKGVFRTYILYKAEGNKLTILELGIESDE